MHLHDVHLASALVAALGTMDSAEFPSLEVFHVRRRVDRRWRNSGVYDVLSSSKVSSMDLSLWISVIAC